MLDELLGRASLKARIAELETERDSLEGRLGGAEDRRAEAVRARQRAEEENNRLEDRIAELEDRVDRAGAAGEPTFRRTETVSGGRLDEVLGRLDTLETDAEGALTAFVDEPVPDELDSLLGARTALVRRAAPCLVCVDDAELVSVALSPPLAPDPFVEWGDSFRLDESWFRPTSDLSVALVRSDLFALGGYESGEWTVTETLESDVMNAHSKGGYSQARFERRRDAQIDEHLDACEELLDEADPERLVCLGERTVLGRFEGRAERVATVDASGDPEEAFASAVRDFFAVRLSAL